MPKGIPRNQSTQHVVLQRLKIARGHLDRVIQMTQDGKYCIDIIHQSMAVQAALRHIDHVMLKNHMETCVAHEIKKGNDRQVVDEIMKVFNKIQ